VRSEDTGARGPTPLDFRRAAAKLPLALLARGFRLHPHALEAVMHEQLAVARGVVQSEVGGVPVHFAGKPVGLPLQTDR